MYPNEAQAYANMAQFCHNTNQLDRAVQYWTMTIERVSKDPNMAAMFEERRVQSTFGMHAMYDRGILPSTRLSFWCRPLFSLAPFPTPPRSLSLFCLCVLGDCTVCGYGYVPAHQHVHRTELMPSLVAPRSTYQQQKNIHTHTTTTNPIRTLNEGIVTTHTTKGKETLLPHCSTPACSCRSTIPPLSCLTLRPCR